MTWQNRITRYSEEAPDQLLANPANYRTHPGSQADALRGVLGQVGIVQNVIANERTGYLVDGHLRVMEALKAGQPSIPVTWVDLDPAEEALVLATLDPLSAMAGTDPSALDALLREVSTDSPALAQMLDALAQEAGIVPGVEAGAGGDDFDATPDDGPTRCALGDLWVIGGVHRLVIGDSTDPATVARLMQGERAALGFADPPYGAKVDEWDQEFVWANDYLADMCGVVVVTPGISSIPDLMRRTVMPYKWSVAAWISNGHARGAIGFGNWMYGAVFSNESVYRTSQDFLKIDLVVGEADGEHHRGQKPPQFMHWIVELFTERGDLVVDPFLGSGTTLIAAHRTGRRCYGVELSPRYGDVILRRAEAEGLTVERIETL